MKPFITIDFNEQFKGIAFYIGWFTNENTFEIVLQIGEMEIAIGVEL